MADKHEPGVCLLLSTHRISVPEYVNLVGYVLDICSVVARVKKNE